MEDRRRRRRSCRRTIPNRTSPGKSGPDSDLPRTPSISSLSSSSSAPSSSGSSLIPQKQVTSIDGAASQAHKKSSYSSTQDTSGAIKSMAVSGSKPEEYSSLRPGRPKTGLISRSELRDEVARAKQEEIARFQSMDPHATGKGAEPTYRDNRGQRISRVEYMRARGKKVKGEPMKKEPEWGKGLVQKRQARAELEELELEKKKPFARSRDDPELDAMLRERVRWGDPMMIKTRLEPVVADLGADEEMRASGFVVPQQVPAQSWIRRGLCEATNRYGIKPGRHWDGVDRSIKFNGG